MTSIFQLTGTIQSGVPPATNDQLILYGNPTDPAVSVLPNSGSQTNLTSVTLQGVPSNQSTLVATITIPVDAAACWTIVITTSSWTNNNSASAIFTVNRPVNSSTWILNYGPATESDSSKLGRLSITTNSGLSRILLNQNAASNNDGTTFHYIRYEFFSGNAPAIGNPVFI